MPCESDRISCLQVMVEHEVVTNIIGVYMPYNDSTSETMEHYLELLDLIQSLMDNFSNAAPTIIVGDFNAALPDSEYLKEKWFCNKPYSKQSAVLYDFLASNERCIANFLFDQEVDYPFQYGPTPLAWVLSCSSVRTHASGVGLCAMSVVSMESVFNLTSLYHEVWRTFHNVTCFIFCI